MSSSNPIASKVLSYLPLSVLAVSIVSVYAVLQHRVDALEQDTKVISRSELKTSLIYIEKRIDQIHQDLKELRNQDK